MRNYKSILLSITAVIAFGSRTKAQQHQFDAPWNTPPESKVMFTVPGVDNIPDLYGDINDPQLVIFFAGNQFMCIDELLFEFKKAYPHYQRIFAETLPPGILAKQIIGGSITIGNMRITLKPDVYTAGKNRINQMPEYFSKTEAYAYNRLAIMVQKGNPKSIKRLTDLGRNDVRVSMPNPDFEGIGKNIEQAYLKTGNDSLRKAVMEDKVKDSTTYLTQIHHRQSPMRLMYDQSDAAPVWFSEGFYQMMINHPVDMVEIPPSQNIKATYIAGQLKNAPHANAARDFMNFLVSPVAKTIYLKYGFTTQ